MSIKFYCTCGKHLRAREAMAGRRSQCPACGAPVGIPLLQPTQRGTSVAPLSADERRSQSGFGASVFATPAPTHDEAAQTPDDAETERRQKRSHLRRVRALEKHWYECLMFPLYAWPLLLPLTLALTALTGIAVLAWPELGDLSATPWWIWLVLWTAPFLTFGYVCAFLQCVLASAAAGETGYVRYPGSDVGLIARSLFNWLVCFLAGPILFAAAAFWFWLYAGDLTFIDWLIVIELALAGTAHWFLALVALHQTDRLRDVNPLRVADLIRRLGYSAVFATLAAAAVILALGYLILFALTELHQEPAVGFPILAAGWLVTLFWLAFLFRLLGLWCFRSRVEGAT
jgi:hypothetical protein